MMKLIPPLAFAIVLIGCGRGDPSVENGDVRAEFLNAVGKDAWADWPPEITAKPVGQWRPCFRVREDAVSRAIGILENEQAVALNAALYRALVGHEREASKDQPYLLRGFATNNSAARISLNGTDVTVHSEGLGGLHGIRRYPCVAYLQKKPTKVHTAAMYDL
jgi:hypothetical protein